jgi:hypothetical protein
MSSGHADILFRHSARGHSADVRIELRLNGRTLAVAQAGGDRLVFDEPLLLPAGDAELAIFVDGRERRWRVTLRPGTEASRVVPINSHANEA